jgi:dihydrofolate reductase
MAWATKRRRVKYFVAVSLDAYLAGPEGQVDWLFTDEDYGLEEFLSTVDTVLIGRKTYEFMLAHDQRAYPGLTNYVFSSTLQGREYPEVQMISADVAQTVAQLRARKGKDIWLMGGGQLFKRLLLADAVDDVTVALHPILLGRGIPMLPEIGIATKLTLKKVTPYATGLIMLHYEVHES